MKKFIKGQRGFTLIEIIIVLAILAILAALLVPQVAGILRRGHAASYEADKSALELATMDYFAVRARWPTHGGVAPHFGAVGRPVPIPHPPTPPAPPADILPANRHGLINITRLVAGGFLAGPDAVRSAGVQQHPGLPTPAPPPAATSGT